MDNPDDLERVFDIVGPVPRPRSWTDDELIAGVAASRTLKEVHERLGLKPGRYDVMRAHIKRLDIDATHLPGADVGAGTAPRRRWSDADLREAVRISDSVSEVSRRLGYSPNGGVHRMMVAHIRKLGLDRSHFTGMAWSKGLRRRDLALPLTEILVQGFDVRVVAPPRTPRRRRPVAPRMR